MTGCVCLGHATQESRDQGEPGVLLSLPLNCGATGATGTFRDTSGRTECKGMIQP